MSIGKLTEKKITNNLNLRQVIGWSGFKCITLIELNNLHLPQKHFATENIFTPQNQLLSCARGSAKTTQNRPNTYSL